jgi:hypothetical protein
MFSEEIKLLEKEFPYQHITVGRANFRYILAGQAENPAVVLLCGGIGDGLGSCGCDSKANGKTWN